MNSQRGSPHQSLSLLAYAKLADLMPNLCTQTVQSTKKRDQDSVFLLGNENGVIKS